MIDAFTGLVFHNHLRQKEDTTKMEDEVILAEANYTGLTWEDIDERVFDTFFSNTYSYSLSADQLMDTLCLFRY